ncbi:ribosomal pseudouridine synthase, putative [Ixodes scapularis]|uniref:Pseudouridylate synthase RPUSD4, mitochondrial n=1 Tax=Ixodes scapularis TaxID=6945 RepID=B7PYG1_IXOSC|nr:ribosomal pseudouridine synthase, putative [Ixodes scapularis]|eukprot:XP_002403064.1 ribosomal pseudouridine synthase, putative [Ixodes scapularis]
MLLLLVRGTNQRTAHNLDLETEAAADDDFFGVASERGVVAVPGSESFTRDRLEKFEHLARSRDARVSDVKVIDAGFGTIRYDSDNQPSLQEFTKRDRSEKIVTERPGNGSRAGSFAPKHLEGADDGKPPDSEEQQTAYDYLRRESPPSSVKLDSKGFRILKSEIRPDLSRLLHTEAVDLLRKLVLYNDNDILVLNKPYGMLCHGPAPGVSDACVLTKLLPDLSSALYPRQDAKLYTVHRLDRDVTGVLLLARTQRMADMLNSLFQKHQVSKTYLAITAGVPDHLEGVIDMPLAEGEVEGAKRMVLNPKLDPEFQRLVPKFRKSFAAVTTYRVLASCGRAGYLELRPTTGVKHQLRAHLGLGLRCPILGDHKYSHLRRLAPQKLPGDMLDRLGIRQSKVRDAPLHLHARAVVVPEILDGRNLTVAAEVPYHFAKNLRRLKLNRN